MGRKTRVAVAMSGGVDSSVAAALLHSEGYAVVGLTMCFNTPAADRRKPSCCGSAGIDDARRVARVLGIPHYVVSLQKCLEERVIADFCKEYMRGRTPNPCVRCNQYVKFGALLKKALSLDAAFLATGHYARCAARQGRYALGKARDLHKDQSYFLYRLSQDQLAHALFPLGILTKQEVRRRARVFGLPVADKPGSQEICFLPRDDYRHFLKNSFACRQAPGDIVDKRGNVLGRHTGVAFYTVGQRKGIGIAAGHPLYVLGIDPVANRITVGTFRDACRRSFWVSELNWIAPLPKKKIEATVKIRYNHPGARAQIVADKKRWKVTCRLTQFAVTPGQSAVFYHRQTVLGGGIIDEVA